MENPVGLQGSAAKVGEALARVVGVRTKQIVLEFMRRQPADASHRKRMDAHRAVFEDLVRAEAPWWLEENRAFCRVAGVDLKLFNTYLAIKDIRPSKSPEGCTSFVSINNAGMLIHKNRDQAIVPQSIFIKKIDGTFKYVGSIELANIGVAYFLNERGLCAVSNTGSPTDDLSTEGFSAHLVMRLLAEKASCCEEALELVRHFTREGLIVARNAGTILFCAEAGRGLVIECTSRTMSYAWITGLEVRANLFALPEMEKAEKAPGPKRRRSSRDRYRRAKTILQDGAANLALARKFSRDRAGRFSICNNKTVSAMTFCLRNEGPPGILAALGNPHATVYMPLTLEMEALPVFCVDGTLWNIARRLDRDGKYGVGVEIERECDAVWRKESEFTPGYCDAVCRRVFETLTSAACHN